MGLDVLLQILRPLEGLAAKIAPMRLQRYMNADVRRDVVAFHNSDATGAPGTSEVKIIGTFTTDVALANMFLSSQDQLKHLGNWEFGNAHRVTRHWALYQRILPTDIGTGCQCSAMV